MSTEPPDTAAPQTVGAVLRAWRKRRGMKQRPIADALGKEQSYISQVERGHIKVPDPVILRDWARVLDMPFREVAAVAGWDADEPQVASGVALNTEPIRESVVPYALLPNLASPLTDWSLANADQYSEAEISEIITYAEYLRARRLAREGRGR